MRISRRRPQAVITHPTQPELQITVQKPDPFEAGEIAAMFRRAERTVAVLGGDGQPVPETRADGTVGVMTEKVMDISPDILLRAVASYVIDIVGLEDAETGKPIEYKGNLPEKLGVLKLLVTDELAIALDPPRPLKRQDGSPMKGPDGKVLEQKQLSVFDWITEKANDPATFGLSSGKA